MSLFDLTAVVSLLGTHTVTVQRPNAQTYGAGGFANAQTFTSSTVNRCSVQPGTGGLVKAPEGVRVSDVVRVWGDFEFAEGDRLTIAGLGIFEVFETDAWTPAGGFGKCFARLLNSSEPRA